MMYPMSPSILEGSVRIIADNKSETSLHQPMDVKFHSAVKEQLWIANYGSSNMLVLHNAGSASMSTQIWQDRAEYHYNHHVSALGFDNVGQTLVTCQQSPNNYYELFKENF